MAVLRRFSWVLLAVGLAGPAHAAPPELSRAAPASPGWSESKPAAGWHAVDHECYVDLGTFLDCDIWKYRLKGGDTLGEVAQRELGSARRQRDILALNPGLTPDLVRAGRTLVMPPRSNGCERDSPRFVFFAWAPDAGGWSMPRHLADARIHRVSHGSRLFAVPVGHLAEVCKASGAQPLCAKALAKDPEVARSGTFQLLATLPDSDPARRLVTHFKVVGVGDGKIRLRQTGHAAYDGAGQRIEPASGGGGGFTLLQMLVFLLMVASIGLAVARVQRRSAAAVDGEGAAFEAAYEDEDEDEGEGED